MVLGLNLVRDHHHLNRACKRDQHLGKGASDGASDLLVEGPFTAYPLTDGNGGDGRHFGFQHGRGRTDGASTRAGRNRGAHGGQRRDAYAIFKHDQSRPLSELNAQLERQGFYKSFPPEGVEVVSWYVMMGIGQVATLRLPASRLREVNRILENTAWGSYHTEFYPTYDYKADGIARHDKAQ
jgi:hypothetical protein